MQLGINSILNKVIESVKPLHVLLETGEAETFQWKKMSERFIVLDDH